MICVTVYSLSLQTLRSIHIHDTYSVHRIVYDLFDDVRTGTNHGSPSGILFSDRGMSRMGRTIIILSNRNPHTPKHGFVRTLELDDAFFEAQHYRFAITVNPVKRIKTGQNIPLIGRSAIEQWFSERATQNGFSVVAPNFTVDDISVDVFEKENRMVTLQKAHITGVLTVENSQLFRAAVCGGIGRGKAFGCGLLQVAPLSF